MGELDTGELDTATTATAWGRAILAVVGRPWLWPAAVRAARTLVPPGWWRRSPYLPLPDRDWLRFRLSTAYGDTGHPPEPDDLLTWIRWTRTFPR